MVGPQDGQPPAGGDGADAIDGAADRQLAMSLSLQSDILAALDAHPAGDNHAVVFAALSGMAYHTLLDAFPLDAESRRAMWRTVMDEAEAERAEQDRAA